MPPHEGALPGKVFVWSAGDIRSVPEKAARRRRRAPLAGPVQESRRYPRADLKLPIQYRVLSGGHDEVPAAVRPFLLAQSRDVTPLGLCLALEEPLPSDCVLSLNVHLVEAREKFEALARVVWCRPAESGPLFLVGLQFVVVDGGQVLGERHALMEAYLKEIDA